jgi:hypothetical protein
MVGRTKQAVNRPNPFSRALGAAITTAEREHARTELDVYRKWFADHIIREDPDTVSSAIMVLPVGSTKPDYRDVLSGPFQARLGVDELTMGSWLGIPELVLPGNLYSRCACRLPLTSSS